MDAEQVELTPAQRSLARVLAWRDANRDRALAARRRNYAKNRARESVRAKAARKKHIEKRRLAERKYREENKEKVILAQRRWRRKNGPRGLKYKKSYLKARPHIRAAATAAYKARKRAAESPSANKQAIRQIYGACQRVSRCLGILHHVDHIVPLTRGGIHHEANLQILPAIINIRKSNKLVA